MSSYKVVTVFIFLIGISSCNKHDLSKVEKHNVLKDWVMHNGESYKNGVLQFKASNGETKAGQLNWPQLKTYQMEGMEYTEVPFSFGEDKSGAIRSKASETNVDAAFYLVMRTKNGQIEGAIKVVQQNLVLKSNNVNTIGTIESFRNLNNQLVNVWFRERENNKLIALKLAENTSWANTISSQSDVKSNSCDISYTIIRVITGGGVSPDSSPDNVSVYSVYTETTMFKIDCSGSGSGATNWPPTPPLSSVVGSPINNKIPCPGDILYTPKVAPSSARNLNGGRFGMTRIDQDTHMPKMHGGLDIYAVPNTPIFSAFDGEITFIRKIFLPNQYAKKSLGNFIEIESTLQDGTKVKLLYGHMNNINGSLILGTKIKQGDAIGLSGLTGNAKRGFSPHVHVQIKINGKPENPEKYLTTKYDNSGNSLGNPCN